MLWIFLKRLRKPYKHLQVVIVHTHSVCLIFFTFCIAVGREIFECCIGKDVAESSHSQAFAWNDYGTQRKLLVKIFSLWAQIIMRTPEYEV